MMMTIQILIVSAMLMSLIFLVTKDIKKSGIFLAALIISLGTSMYVVEASFFAYILIFFGVISVIIAIFFSSMLIVKKGPSKKAILPIMFSGVFILAIFGALVFIINKNYEYINYNNFQNASYEKIFSSMKYEYLIPIELMAILILIGLICIREPSEDSGT